MAAPKPPKRSRTVDTPPIDFISDWDAELDSFLAERIYEFNSRVTGLFDGKALGGRIRDEAERVIAAFSGHTWGGTCQLTYLWVEETYRGRGLGRRLLDAAEGEARRRGCTQVVLWTHSFQAPGFYERMGYRLCATIPSYPAGHSQLVYVKQLQDVPR